MSKIAIIGTGIAGLGCAHFLHSRHELALFEQNDYVGGHTNTVNIDENGVAVPIDTGFMVFNEVTYPNLTRLFKELVWSSAARASTIFSLSAKICSARVFGK